jgi:hypothetical protein
MVKSLELALAKAAGLPEAAQERLGRDLLERIDRLASLRADVNEGLAELDAGLGRELDFDELIREAHNAHGRTRRLIWASRPPRLIGNLDILCAGWVSRGRRRSPSRSREHFEANCTTPAHWSPT